MDATGRLLNTFRWVGGHADVWRCFADADCLRAVIAGLAEPWRDAGITAVAGVEARGFLLGPAVALELGVGFVAIRKTDGLLPGPKRSALSAPDYRGRRHELRVQRVFGPSDRVLLVDDWAERGSQALAARELVVGSGAEFAGVSVMVDQLDDARRAELGRVTSMVRRDLLGDDGGGTASA